MTNRPENIILEDVFFGAKKGDVAHLQEAAKTHLEVCDMCGKKRKCAYYICNNDRGTTFIDVCRECGDRLSSEDDT